MLFYQVAFGTCLLLLGGSCAALVAAHKKGDKRQASVLHIFRLGLSLSALSYLLRIVGPLPAGHTSFPVFVTCFAGTIFIWLGWIEHWKMRLESLHERAVPQDKEYKEYDESGPSASEGVPAFLTEKINMSRLTSRARQALLSAQQEARRRGQCCVDTDHLLMGLLRDPRCAGVQILNRLDSSPEKVHMDLLGRTASSRNLTGETRAMEKSLRTQLEQVPITVQERGTQPLALTDRAQQVIDLAAQEAHRFDRVAIGTEHLMLGLMLMGRGPAAAVLFGEGITVERVRDEIIYAKNSPHLEKP